MNVTLPYPPRTCLDLREEVQGAASERRIASEAEAQRLRAYEETKVLAALALLQDALRADLKAGARYDALQIREYRLIAHRAEARFFYRAYANDPTLGAELAIYKEHPCYKLVWLTNGIHKPFTYTMAQENLWDDLLVALSAFEAHYAQEVAR